MHKIKRFKKFIEEKPFECKWKGCNKRFANSSDRKKHQNVHLKTTPHICGVSLKQYNFVGKIR